MTKSIVLSDFPKIQCPFIRAEFPVERTSWKKYGQSLGLRKPTVYLVLNKINPGYEWVFDDIDTFATEKIDGSNVKIQTENGRLIAVQNRKNIIDPLQVIKGPTHYIEGVFRSISKGYVELDGVQAGELIGPKLQSNPYQLDHHLWYPFHTALTQLRYKSFDKHDRNIAGWSLWMEKYIFSLFMQKRGIKNVFPEGIVLYNLKRKIQGKSYMAKLRRDMFDWFYADLELPTYERDY